MKSYNQRILIFETSVAGHRLEYIHHLYNKALDYPNKKIVFALPKEFLNVKDKLDWTESSNIEFYLFEEEFSFKSYLKGSFHVSRFLKSIIKEFYIDTVFLISMMHLMPLLAFILPRKVKLSGIVYNIYLYAWKATPRFKRRKEAFKYLLLAKMSRFKNIFILNDSISARHLNIKFKTDKFLPLPDPFVPIPPSNLHNLREELNILPSKTVLLHFGGLTHRKGTLDILKAIELLNENELKDLCFIFAGKVYEEIKHEFHALVDKQSKRVQIVCFDKFCDFSFLGSLCISCDYILTPYKDTAQSSGILGYAAQFNKPLIAPRENLIGKLVEKHNLGITLEKVDSSSLASTFKSLDRTAEWIKTNSYLKINNIDNFSNKIFDTLLAE